MSILQISIGLTVVVWVLQVALVLAPMRPQNMFDLTPILGRTLGFFLAIILTLVIWLVYALRT